MTTPSALIAELTSMLEVAGVADAAAAAGAIVDAVASRPDAERAQEARRLAAARAAGTPLAYLTGRARFLGVEMVTSFGALVPREETELLGRTALEILDRGYGDGEPLIIDMCCGSGNLACALATLRPHVRVWAADLTDGAVKVARANVERLGLTGKVEVRQGDLFAPLAGIGLEGRIDVIVCNPPYISTGKLERERADLLDHEPREAFDGGPYGVSIFQRVIRDAVRFLRPGGHVMFEVGQGQDRQVTQLFTRANSYEGIESRLDPGGVPRVVLARIRSA